MVPDALGAARQVTDDGEGPSDAAAHDQWIAGSISTFAHDHDRKNLPLADKLESNVARQAEILTEAGCDLIALEMLFDVELIKWKACGFSEDAPFVICGTCH